MDRVELQTRTKRYALRIIKVYVALDRRGAQQVLGHQMLRSGTSVGAHHREACRARSQAEFVSKIQGGLQELDETAYWLELLIESGAVPPGRSKPLIDETEQLLSIFTASAKTAKRRLA